MTSPGFEGQLLKIQVLDPFECGSEAARAQFAFDEGYIFLNHGNSNLKRRWIDQSADSRLLGSYGTYPIPVRNIFRHYQERAEAQPDTFVRYGMSP